MMNSLILMKMKTWGQRRLIGSQWIFEARALASGSALQQVNNKKTSWSFVPKNLIFAKTKGRGYNLWKFVSGICVDGQIDVAVLKPAWKYPKGLVDVIKQGGLINTCHKRCIEAFSEISPSFDLFKLRLWCPSLTSSNLLLWSVLIVPEDSMYFSPVPIWSYQFAVKCRFIFCKYSHSTFRTD